MILFAVVLILLTNIFALDIDDEQIDLSDLGDDIYGKPVVSNARNSRRQYGNPEERGPYLEGDLLNPTSNRNGIKSESLRWKNREVPYEIGGGFGNRLGFHLKRF
jgi:hypothetical protein